ncbi:Hsf-type dna-binding protein [Globisporangium polare]
MQIVTTSRSTISGPIESANSCTNKADKDVAPFLKSLRKMLDHESDAILRWTPNGRAFEIHDMEQMMDYVLPKYFKHRKYTSFQRQLNYFNFRKWTKSKAVVCTFSNDFFLRDQPELAWRISRKKSLHHPSGAGASSPTGHHQREQLTHKFFPKPRANRVPSMPHLQHQHQQQHVVHSHALPRPHQVLAHPYWMKNEGVVISVPRPSSLSDMSSRMPYPSPTDQDMMLKEHDHAAAASRRHFYNRHYDAPAFAQAQHQQTQHHHQQHESMDWIDCLLPPVDRIEDEIYTYMYPPSSASSAISKSSFEFVATTAM